jgi:crossover junction endodeoxyribonuclease RuvC
MLILGIDPGLRITGYGAVRCGGRTVALVEAGVIRTPDKGELASRLHELAGGLRQVIAALGPDAVVVESLYSHYKHPLTSILMGHARGLALLAAAELGVPVFEYPATRIKKSLTGNGRAAKDQMQHTIATTLGLAHPPEPPDVADALAAALCHANVVRHEIGGIHHQDTKKRRSEVKTRLRMHEHGDSTL